MSLDKKPTLGRGRKGLHGRIALDQAAGRPTMMNIGTLKANRLIADFMKISNGVEQYLHHKGPLTTDLQYDSVPTTLEGLRTFLLTWRTQFRTGKR
jgi:hypothetical protein